METAFRVFFYGMGAFLLLIGLLLAYALPRERRAETERANARADREAKDAAYEAVCRKLVDEVSLDYSFVELIEANGAPTILALKGNGSAIRLISWERHAAKARNIADETFPAKKVIGLSIDQPQVSRVVAHKEKTPVAVNVRRSAGGRALVGGILAGPVGAQIGMASGLNGKSKIKMIETERHETVYSKGHPTLIVQLDDLTTPRRALVFKDIKTTNEWSSRIHAAMQRGRV